jgi:hypothetical protein
MIVIELVVVEVVVVEEYVGAVCSHCSRLCNSACMSSYILNDNVAT